MNDGVRQAKVDRREDGDLLITGVKNPSVSVEVNAETGEVKKTDGPGGVRVVGVEALPGGATLHLGSCDW